MDIKIDIFCKSVRDDLPFRIRIKDARGALVRELRGALQDSTGGVVFPIPGEQPSGVYRAFCTVNGSAEAERSFEIRMRPASPMVRGKRNFFEWEFTKKMNAVGL